MELNCSRTLSDGDVLPDVHLTCTVSVSYMKETKRGIKWESGDLRGVLLFLDAPSFAITKVLPVWSTLVASMARLHCLHSTKFAEALWILTCCPVIKFIQLSFSFIALPVTVFTFSYHVQSSQSGRKSWFYNCAFSFIVFSCSHRHEWPSNRPNHWPGPFLARGGSPLSYVGSFLRCASTLRKLRFVTRP